MSAVLAAKDLPAVIGAAFEGGFFFDQIMVDRRPHAIIVPPKGSGEIVDVRWNKNMKRVPGACSYNDSYANTVAMAEAGSKAAKDALAANINGYRDWCIPARDVLERMYFLGKPTKRANSCWYRDGENPSAVPPAYPYTEKTPGQTAIEAFREGGAEAFEDAYYWSSTQFEGDGGNAWAQLFGNGNQSLYLKVNEFRVRLVRLIQI